MSFAPKVDKKGEQESGTCKENEGGKFVELRELSSEEYGRTPKVGAGGMRADQEAKEKGRNLVAKMMMSRTRPGKNFKGIIDSN